jgi:hypothetical protein
VRNDELFCLGVVVRKALIPILLPEFVYRIRLWLALRYRKLRYGCTFRKIPLTQGKYAIVDPEDYKELAKYNWYAKKCERRYYAERWGKTQLRLQLRRGRQGSRTRGAIKMHRVIMGDVEGKFIDHINHDGLDNRKANLRFATTQQNTWNKRKQKGNYSSQYKGVHWVKSEKNWRAVITCNKRVIYIGRFDDEKAAAMAYDAKAKELFGEYAAPNLPSESRG